MQADRAVPLQVDPVATAMRKWSGLLGKCNADAVGKLCQTKGLSGRYEKWYPVTESMENHIWDLGKAK